MLPQTSRSLESAADELGRLDEIVSTAPRAVGLALRAGLIARFGRAGEFGGPETKEPDLSLQATPDGRASLVAAAVDVTHGAALPEWLGVAKGIVDEEERRAATGAPLTVGRVLAHEAALAGARDGVSQGALSDAPSPMNLAALEEVLRPGGQPRPVLMRAVAASAAIAGAGTTPEAAATAGVAADSASAARPLAELVPALLLCSAGMTEQLRILPFAEMGATARAEALEAWRSGDEEPFARLALGECARAARERRLAVRAMLAALAEDEARLVPLGRGAITARRALQVLRDSLATTMPLLSEQLECSRPAAGEALERLVSVGLAVEITGRQRDRVYACAHSWNG